MTGSRLYQADPSLDMVLERTVTASPERVWDAWTVPGHVVNWFAPAPYTTTECDIDLRPGGVFRTVMRSPDGDEHTTTACYLEVDEHQRLVWTTALGPGFRPIDPAPVPAFTAVITLEPADAGTTYSALVMHADQEALAHHAALGFREGWNKTHDQLAAMLA